MSLPTPYYDEDGITIYCGDCREILPSLPDVDCLLTDPPYGIGFRDYATHVDDAGGYVDFIWPAIEAAEMRVRKGGVAAVFQSEVNVARWSEIVPRPFRLVSVCKTFGQVGREILMRQTDFVLYWRVGGWDGWSREEWQRVSDWQYPNARNWVVSSDASRTSERWPHPCPRTLDAMRYLVACFCQPDGLILEPFMGSGTTLVAAKQLGRRAIGIEIEERYCAIAVERLRQTVLRFKEKKPEPEQASMLDGDTA